VGSRGGRHRLTRRTRQELRMRPGPRRKGVRATARALLSVATGLLLIGGGAAILHHDGPSIPVAFTARD